ncbi:MAG TPA: alcohol dehydrogenase catalytic domain-containing protein [Solirubrobacteraceae bacterium]|jgi:alcohol dehydrogenase|nr:alcohol dehydrogenase catalytic domain-containing protein [Solirubrobacteraceae bacterium]
MQGADPNVQSVERGQRDPRSPAGPSLGLAGCRRRPRGSLRHYAGFLSPSAAAAMPLLLERDRAARLRRLVATVGDRAAQRRRPTRPRMRALTAAPGGRLRWREVPVPASPGPHGAIVHPIAIATCDIDCPLFLGATQLALPLHLGHECVAEVLSVGERVAAVRPGDRVVVPFQISCGDCANCRAGRPGNCLAVPPLSAYGMGLATGHFGGAFSDQLAVPYADAMLVPLPEGVDPVAAASVSDNVCDAYRHIGPHLPALLKEDPDAEVLILAALSRPVFSASVPLYTGLIARAHGARNVSLVDSRPHVRAHAERLGLNALRPRELRGRPSAPLVVHISADPLATALAHTAPDGICTSSGGLHRNARIPLLQMYVRRATLHIGIPHARALMPDVLELMAQGRLRPEDVITAVAPLDHGPGVLREHFLGGGVKTVLTA